MVSPSNPLMVSLSNPLMVSLSNHAVLAFKRRTRARIRIIANDIVKICALSDRRQLADVPRLSRAGPHDRRRTASQRARHADQCRVHLRHDAPQAPQRAQAGAHRGVLRFAGPDVPRRPRRRLQSQPRADAGRARRADPDGARGVRGIVSKAARELIAAYGSLVMRLAHAPKVKHKRYREGLLANAEQARRSRELARIRTDVPVDLDPPALQYRGGSRERSFQIFNELGFRTIAKEYA